MPMKYPPHPGRSILRDCMDPLGMSVAETAQKLGMSAEQLARVIDGQADISLSMAIALDKLFGGGASTWYQLQTQYDEAQRHNKDEVPEEPDPLSVYQQTATIPLEHGRVVYRTFDAEVIVFRIVPSADPALSDSRNYDRVEFRLCRGGARRDTNTDDLPTFSRCRSIFDSRRPLQDIPIVGCSIRGIYGAN